MAPIPDWFLDPRSGRRAPDSDYAFDINHRDEARVGNVKYVWELSRHHHLTLLAAAYALSGDERFAARAALQLRDWWRNNPFLTGIHWSSGIELGLRLITWVWVRRLLNDWPGVADLFEDNPVFLEQLHGHQFYLARMRSHGSSANNHLIAEAAGLFASCCALPLFAESETWRHEAAATLTTEIARQTFTDGLNREQATDYHGFVLELCLAAALEGEAAGQALGPAVWQPIRSMVDALAAILDVKGRPPRQGDSDDGLALLLDAPGFARWQSLLATGEALFGSCAWWPEVPHQDARTAFWSALGKADLGAAPARPAQRRSFFPQAGMVLLRDPPGRSDEIWCRCDHGPHGYLSIAAHAHADALSIELRHGGVEILVDPGTYCYHGDPEWRAYFRSTLAHNTLELAGRDQSISGGPFLWTRHAVAKLIQVAGLDGGAEAQWRALHEGYKDVVPAVVHERQVRLDRGRRRLVVNEHLHGGGQHACRLAFHLGPRVVCNLTGNLAVLRWRAGKTAWSASMTLSTALQWSAVKGQASPPCGWYAPAFDQKWPTTTLIGQGKVTSAQVLRTVLQFGDPEPLGGQSAVPERETVSSHSGA